MSESRVEVTSDVLSSQGSASAFYTIITALICRRHRVVRRVREDEITRTRSKLRRTASTFIGHRREERDALSEKKLQDPSTRSDRYANESYLTVV